MKVAYDFPPNYDQIVNTPILKVPSNAVFTYGDTLYCPLKQPIPPDLMIHEEVHVKQQGDKPNEWWDRYLSDGVFRFTQELEAYRAQYQFLCSKIKNRDNRAKVRIEIAKVFSSDMYGNIISYADALKALR